MKRLIIIFAILLTSAYGQVRIADFSGGLNTNTSPFLLKPNEGVVCLNWDLCKGMLLKRSGYLSIDTNYNDLYYGGVYGYTGQAKKLFGVERVHNTAGYEWHGLGQLTWSSDYGYHRLPLSDTAQSKNDVWQYIYFGEEPPYWATWKDAVYFSNGRQRPLVWSDSYLRLLTPTAPGEPLIVPMSDSGTYGGLDGAYRYLIVARGFCGASLTGELITNYSFEDYTELALDYVWSQLVEYGTVAANVDNELADTACAFMNTWYNSGTGDGLSDTVVLSQDTTYRFSVWAKGSAATGNICAGLWAYNKDTVKIGLDSLAPTTSYGELQFFYTPTEADTVAVFIGNLIRNPFGDDDVDWYYDSLSVLKMSDVKYAESYISQPIKAFKEKTVLTHFPFHALTMECDAQDSAGWDSLALYVYRTLASPGNLTVQDSFYLVKAFNYLSQTNVDTLRIIDSLADTVIDGNAVLFPDTLRRGRDSSGVITGYRVGAPTFVDTVMNDVWIFPDVFSVSDTLDMIWTAYLCTYYDTLIGAESDSSRVLYVGYKAGDSAYSLGLPSIPDRMPNYIRRLYRAMSFINIDTGAQADTVFDTTLIVDWQRVNNQYFVSDDYYYLLRLLNDGRLLECKPPFQTEVLTNFRRTPGKTREYHVRYTNKFTSYRDSITTPFYLIAEIKGSDSAYTDTVKFDSSLKGAIYWRSGAPLGLNGVTAFDDKLWGYEGSTVYWSYLDSGSYWGAFKNIVVNADDGDEITAVVPFREYVKVYKNRAQYVLTPGPDGGYSSNWISEGLGCIAPHSLVKVNNGLMYLSEYGVVSEGAGQSLERASTSGIISQSINDLLLNRPATDLRKMVAVVADQKYRLSMPSKDTTFVYDMVTGAWGIWNYSFLQAVLFDTVKYPNKIPSQELLFVRDGSPYLFKADTGYDNNGTAYLSQWRSAPIGLTSELFRLSSFGVWRWGKGLHLRLYDENGDSVGYKLTDSTDRHYEKYGLAPNLSGYFQIDIRDNTTADSLRIEAIDVWTDTPTTRTGR